MGHRADHRRPAQHARAVDLLTLPTLTFKTLYVLVCIAHGRRELVHVNLTANRTTAWMWRQIIEAMPWGQKPRPLLRDRDAVYGCDFRKRARRIGIDAVATPIHAPKANGTVLTEFVQHYNQERPHGTLGLQTSQPKVGPPRHRPIASSVERATPRLRTGRLSTTEVLPPTPCPM